MNLWGSNAFFCIPKYETPANAVFTGVFSGALNQIRTGDLILTKDALCLLSYKSLYSFLIRVDRGAYS